MVSSRIHIAFAAAILCAGTTAAAQSESKADALLTELRAAAASSTGDLPTSLRYVKFAEAMNRRSALVEGADTGRVALSFAVFQIRYPNRWFIVDAGFDRDTWTQFYGTTPVTYWPERWDRVQEAFRGADAIVLTHEHWDHAGGVERGTGVPEFAGKVQLTSAQIASLLDPPAPFYIRLARDSSPPYHRLDYERVHAIGPGVVLVKAPGHSPGSQWVYVRLASGAEVLLVGDLVWNMAGLDLSSQRPQRTSAAMKEDRKALQQQIELVGEILHGGKVTVIPSHDDALLSSVAARGLLFADFDLSRK